MTWTVILITAGVVSTNDKQRKAQIVAEFESRIDTLETQQADLSLTCTSLSSNDMAMANGVTAALQAYSKVIVENKNSHIILSNTFKEYYGEKKWIRMLQAGMPEQEPQTVKQ